jgi:hypothetical protein
MTKHASKFGSSFSCQDKHALVERYILSTTVNDETLEDDDFMKLDLVKGLIRVTITDNAQRTESHRKPTTDPSMLCLTRTLICFTNYLPGAFAASRL